MYTATITILDREITFDNLSQEESNVFTVGPLNMTIKVSQAVDAVGGEIPPIIADTGIIYRKPSDDIPYNGNVVISYPAWGVFGPNYRADKDYILVGIIAGWSAGGSFPAKPHICEHWILTDNRHEFVDTIHILIKACKLLCDINEYSPNIVTEKEFAALRQHERNNYVRIGAAWIKLKYLAKIPFENLTRQ